MSQLGSLMFHAYRSFLVGERERLQAPWLLSGLCPIAQ